jgi:hypothetical protein
MFSLDLISFPHLLIISLLLILSKWIYTFILKPLRLINFYKKQGAETIFFPGIGFAKANIESLSKYADCYHYEKQMAINKPETRIWATNLGKNVILHILDPKLLREFYKKQGTETNLYTRDLDFWWVFLETTGHNITFVEG